MNWNLSGFGKRRSLKNARFSFLLPFVAFPLLHRDLSPSGPKSWARGIRPLLGTSPWFNLMSSIFHFEQKLRFLTRYNSPILAKVWGMCRSRDLGKSVRQRRACDESIHPAPRDGARASRTWKVTLVPPVTWRPGLPWTEQQCPHQVPPLHFQTLHIWAQPTPHWARSWPIRNQGFAQHPGPTSSCSALCQNALPSACRFTLRRPVGLRTTSS